MQMINLMKRLAELDAQNPNRAKDNVAEGSDDLRSGIKKSISECGQMGMMGQSNTPASLNITAASGPELSGMLRDIMQLAGMAHAPEEEPLSTEPVDHLEPANAMQASPTDSMRSVIDLLNPDDEDGEEDDKEMTEYDTSPDPETTGYSSMTPAGNDLHKSKGTYPKVAGGDNPMQSTMEQLEQKLFDDYKKFVNE